MKQAYNGLFVLYEKQPAFRNIHRSCSRLSRGTRSKPVSEALPSSSFSAMKFTLYQHFFSCPILKRHTEPSVLNLTIVGTRTVE